MCHGEFWVGAAWRVVFGKEINIDIINLRMKSLEVRGWGGFFFLDGSEHPVLT